MATKQAQRQDLDVHLGTEGRLIGHLYLGSGKRSAFRYDEGWLRDPRFFTVSPDLQPVSGVQHPQGVFFRALKDTAPVDFLTWLDDEARVGALRLFDPQGGTYLHTGGTHRHIPPLVELDKVLHAAGR